MEKQKGTGLRVISLNIKVCQRASWILALLAMIQPVLHAQDRKYSPRELPVPHTVTSVPIDCSDSSAIWRNVPSLSLSKKSVADPPPSILPTVLDAMRPIAAIVQMNDPSKPVSKLPPAVQNKLDSLHEQYAFQWDDGKLYGYVEIIESDWDSGHPRVSEKEFNRSPERAAASDFFFSSVIVEVGAPSWQRWITEMHVHIRSPKAAPMSAMLFGRTNNDEEFRRLAGEALACPKKDGWIAKFSVDWLPFDDWHPVSGAVADIRLFVPLAHAKAGYVLGSVVPIVLTR